MGNRRCDGGNGACILEHGQQCSAAGESEGRLGSFARRPNKSYLTPTSRIRITTEGFAYLGMVASVNLGLHPSLIRGHGATCSVRTSTHHSMQLSYQDFCGNIDLILYGFVHAPAGVTPATSASASTRCNPTFQNVIA
jgi:hypothetical protein